MGRATSLGESPSVQLDATVLVEGAARLGVALSRAQVDAFRWYYRGMMEWNERLNLTTVTAWEQVQERHFVESLAVSRAVPRATLESGRFVDVGTGAGLPGIPLKIAFAGMMGTLIEATGRKVEFLNWVIDELGLTGIDVGHGRAESLGHVDGLREGFDLVVARAVAPMCVLAELTLPFCRVGGQVVVHKTAGAIEEIDAAGYGIGVLGGEVRRTVPGTVEMSGSTRTLVVIEKVADTPSNYPRRPGVPAKRPLLKSR